MATPKGGLLCTKSTVYEQVIVHIEYRSSPGRGSGSQMWPHLTGAHCNYFGPMTPGTGGLPANFRFLKRPLIAFIEDTYVFCYIKQAKRAFIYKMQSLIFK